MAGRRRPQAADQMRWEGSEESRIRRRPKGLVARKQAEEESADYLVTCSTEPNTRNQVFPGGKRAVQRLTWSDLLRAVWVAPEITWERGFGGVSTIVIHEVFGWALVWGG